MLMRIKPEENKNIWEKIRIYGKIIRNAKYGLRDIHILQKV